MNRQDECDIIRKLPYDYELAHRFMHKGCKESAYPVTIINESDIIWECLIHGFIERRQVSWR